MGHGMVNDVEEGEILQDPPSVSMVPPTIAMKTPTVDTSSGEHMILDDSKLHT